MKENHFGTWLHTLFQCSHSCLCASLGLCLGWLCCNCHNPHAHDSSHDAHDTWATWLIVNCRELFANVATHHWIRPPKTCQELDSKRGLTFTIVCVCHCLMQHVHIKGFANFIVCLQPQLHLCLVCFSNPTHKTKTGTANNRETTNSTPPGAMKLSSKSTGVKLCYAFCGKILGQNHFDEPNLHVLTSLHPIFSCWATYWAQVELL